MREIDEEDVRQRLGESSSQSPTAAPLGHPPGLDAAMLVKFATPESTPAGTLRSGSPGVVTSGVQRQQQIARAVVRKDLLLVRGAAPSTPRERPQDMPLPQDGIK